MAAFFAFAGNSFSSVLLSCMISLTPYIVEKGYAALTAAVRKNNHSRLSSTVSWTLKILNGFKKRVANISWGTITKETDNLGTAREGSQLIPPHQ
jgi:hypothetical protein